ncbi:MAG: VOC family protein [Oleispira sp.]|nr:VOC family protein [Oleispira sp.]
MRTAEHEKINYLEFPAKDIIATKQFFKQVFNWQFTDYGPDYSAFSAADAGLDGGFYRADLAASTHSGSALVVFFSSSLEQTEQKISAAGGSIVKAIFPFPGGRRFHFTDPSGNEFAVWSNS